MKACLRIHGGLPFAALVVIAWTPLLAQQTPSPSPPPEERPAPVEPEAEEAGAQEEQPPEEEFKAEEPATPAEKLKKEELEKRACPTADVKFKTSTDKKSHPTAEPPADKALVYVLRPTMLGNKVQSKLAVDGQWVGANRGHNYFFLTLEPGEHYFCSKAENKSVLAVKVEAGKTYFVEQRMKMGFMTARNHLALLSDQEGRKKLAKSHPSSWEQKK
jgi:uncharacterized protein DUF2846